MRFFKNRIICIKPRVRFFIFDIFTAPVMCTSFPFFNEGIPKGFLFLRPSNAFITIQFNCNAINLFNSIQQMIMKNHIFINTNFIISINISNRNLNLITLQISSYLSICKNRTKILLSNPLSGHVGNLVLWSVYSLTP